MAEDRIDPMDAGGSAETWRKGLAGAIGLIAGTLLFALVLLVAHSNGERDAALQRERRSYDVLMVVRGIDSSMARAEAALGRFVINGNPETGTLYYNAWKQASRQLSRLEQLTADNPDQAALVGELKAVYVQRGAELAAPATRAFYKQGWAALSLFDQAGKSSAINRIAAILSQLEKNERARLGQRSNSADDQAHWANRLSKLLSGMGLLIGLSAILLGWLMFNALHQRRLARRIAATQSDRAELLQLAVAERTRELSSVNEKLVEEAATRAAAEAQLRQIQKMEAVGQLTGGIAHDFNNMLAVVIGGLDLAKRRLDRQREDVHRHIDNALEGANRAASLTQRLLAFSREERLQPEGVVPGAVVVGMSDLLDRTLGERIAVETIDLTSQWQICVDLAQFENVILNLAVNARDAMDDEGVLTISDDQLRLGDGEVASLLAGEYVRITVSDTGCGMDEKVVERAFEPFFTTKPVGKGTGLGLSQVFSFVRQSHGDITIDSIPGKGTRVSLYLPRYIPDADAQPVSVRARSSDEMVLPAMNILLVEDDARVRAATISALEELGHCVTACESGADALAVLAGSQDFEIVISDVIMPGMTGPELVARITAEYPHIAVLFVTGYAGEAGEAENFAAHELLRKPFTIKALSGALSAALRPRLSGSNRPGIGAAVK